MSAQIQSWIHSLEEGAGARYLRWICVASVLAGLAVLYDTLAFRNLSCPEAMEAAQLARNLSEGKGYTTQVIRPFSAALLQEHRPDHSPMLKTPHPDLVNPPLYPVLLAGVLKTADTLLQPDGGIYTMPQRGFRVHRADMAVAVFNQVLFLLSAGLLFRIAARLFDRQVAWVSAVVFLGSELFWKFSVSGLGISLLVLITLAIAWVLVRMEEGARSGMRPTILILLAAALGGLAGAGALTRYAYGWILVPALLFFVWFCGPRPGRLCAAALAVFLACLAPWAARNMRVCGVPFGLATFAPAQGTRVFPSDRLERTLDAKSVWKTPPMECLRKLAGNTRDLIKDDLPRSAGSWAAVWFLAGLMSPFRGLGAVRLRRFMLAGLGVFILVQALCRTALSDESLVVNSENLLVLLAPLALMFGVSFFFVLLDSLELPTRFLRLGAISLFAGAVSLPLIGALLPPRVSPVSYPPYYPPMLRSLSVWMDPQDLVMTDVPWAVAWYGRRQAILPTINWKKDFFAVSDFMKPVHALYLTPRTTDTQFISTWVKGEEQNWCKFLFEIISKSEVPSGFPLRYSPVGFLFPEQVLLTDVERWKFKNDQPLTAP